MIALENVVKRYGATLALRNVSFEVPRGQIVGFLGPNGAGKTTTMRILTGFISPTEGEVRVDGLDVLTSSLEVRRRMGYLPESAPVYQDIAVEEYLTFVGRIRGLEGAALNSRRGAVMEITGLENVRGREISTLSKGYRQRVGLAQALIHSPPILILDEPTSGLDPNQIAEIRDVIKQIGREKTVLLSSHILSEVEVTTDRVIIISQGRIVADAATDALRRERLFIELEVPDGVTRAQVVSRLATVGEVTSDVDEGKSDPKIYRFFIEFTGADEREGRRRLFELVVQARWVLLEVRREKQSLETIFRDLTRAERREK